MPPWRLPSGGTSAATINQLAHVIGACEAGEKVGGAFVVAGLVVEFISALAHVPYDSWAGTWIPVFADFLVAGGVVSEILFASRAGSCQGELTRRSNERLEKAVKEASEARERAAAIEKFTAWRRVSLAQRQQLIANLSALAAEIDLLIEYQTADPEAFLYANEIKSVFREAGVKKIKYEANMFMSANMFGMYGATNGIDISLITEVLELNAFAVDLPTFRPRGGAPTPNLYIFVGVKIPPNLWEERGDD